MLSALNRPRNLPRFSSTPTTWKARPAEAELLPQRVLAGEQRSATSGPSTTTAPRRPRPRVGEEAAGGQTERPLVSMYSAVAPGR